jgi:hypothetical protein
VKRALGIALVAGAAIAAAAAAWHWQRQQPVALRAFEDVTAASGIAYTGMTHGAAWADADGDGLPDLYVTNHLQAPTLYRNLGGGRFADVTATWFRTLEPKDDKHGAAWGDADNDGRPDLVQLTGAKRGVGEEPKRLFMNGGDHFEEVAQALGLANPLGRTRMPLWFDFDRDGRLDLFHGAEARFDDRTPPFVFMQRDGGFVATDDVVRFESRTVPFCIVTDLANTGAPDLLCRISGKGKTAQVFGTASLPLKEREPLPPTAFEDVAAGDFDNDGWIDLFMARKNPAPPVGMATAAPGEVIADLWIDGGSVGKPTGFSFRTTGTPTFRVAPANPNLPLGAQQVRIGASGSNPPGMEFSVAPGDPSAQGAAAFQPGEADGLYVSFSPPDKWQVVLSASRATLEGGKTRYQQVGVKVTSTEPISQAEPIGNPSGDEAAPFRLFMNRKGKLVEESEKRGVNRRLVSAVNVVAGDFDNDMDLDLFVVVSGDIGNPEDLLLLNRGDGTFDAVSGAGGAAGGPAGVGDSVTTADFDGDGRLDLLVAGGASMGRSLGFPSESGSYRLYRNALANGNHWLQVDLQGTKSNRDGIGARVEVTAGGVTQVRIQDGGIHHRGQNHSRLHFGLGRNASAERIAVRWPSGQVQELEGVGADRVLRIEEPR